MITLHVRRYIESTKDSHGNPIQDWAAGVEWSVWALAPGANVEPGDPNRDLSLILWTIYAPTDDSAPTERDLVTVDNVDYAVAGRPKDWTRGPWAHPTAGLVVELKRAEG